ncbi:MAG: septum formation initiator family protein [Bacteroidetes bacterium]|nr:septum formation initiator family protein [Bacteroidota bacterium]
MTKNKILAIVYFFFIILLIAFLFFNDGGVVKYLSLKNKIDDLNNEIEKTENQIQNLEMEIDSLQNSELKIEQVAREKFYMQRADEKAFKIEEK